ncbi:hypothetical protein AA3271_1358 [Gluconobacter japonicus NBRC 3271]|nr:hypothetical protein AA3271_1358 [Gluconobacter japonicus NBRC 3271]
MLRGFTLPYAPDDFRAMQTIRTFKQARAMIHATTFRIVSPKHHTLAAEMYDRPRTHRAWLQRNDQCASGQPRGPKFPRGFPHGQEFSMR